MRVEANIPIADISPEGRVSFITEPGALADNLGLLTDEVVHTRCQVSGGRIVMVASTVLNYNGSLSYFGASIDALGGRVAAAGNYPDGFVRY